MIRFWTTENLPRFRKCIELNSNLASFVEEMEIDGTNDPNEDSENSAPEESDGDLAQILYKCTSLQRLRISRLTFEFEIPIRARSEHSLLACRKITEIVPK